MKTFTKAEMAELISRNPVPGVSIFLKTHPSWPEKEHSVIKLKNSIKEAKSQLAGSGYDEDMIKKILRQADKLLEDEEFWARQSEGLAVFLSKDFFVYYRLPVSFEDRVIVSSYFYLKPLIPILTETGRYYILDLNIKNVRLFEATYDSIRQFELGDIKTNIEDLIEYKGREDLQVHTGGGGGANTAFYGDFYTNDDQREEIRIFYKQVESSVQELLKDSSEYMILVGVEGLQSLYRGITTYRHITEDGLDGSWDHLHPNELQQKTFEIIKPYFEKDKKEAINHFNSGNYRDRVITGLKAILGKSYSGLVETLFVKKGVIKWGTFNTEEFHLNVALESDGNNYDLLNFAVIHTLLYDGRVFLVEDEEFEHDIGAILRFNPKK
jgi:hypothetical protein